MNILLTEPRELHPEALNMLRKKGHKLFSKCSSKTAEKIDALFIRTYTHADENYLRGFPNLKYILRAGVGLDNIDLKTCEKMNIRVFNSPTANTNAVAEYVIGATFFLLRNTALQQRSLNSGLWRNLTNPGQELISKKIGIIGCGAIGKLLARKFRSLGVETVLGFDPYVSAEDLKKNGIEKKGFSDIFRISDILSLHLPLTEKTKHLITLREFKTMKRNAFVINTSRGGIIKESDLIAALNKKMIAGAALDVFENEPSINKRLLALPNVFLTPHIAGFTEEANKAICIEAVTRFLNEH